MFPDGSSKVAAPRRPYFECVCRLCANVTNTNELIDIFNCDLSDMSQLLENFLDIHIDETDPLPDVICAKCLNQMNTILDYRTRCKQAETRLWKLLKNGEDHCHEMPLPPEIEHRDEHEKCDKPVGNRTPNTKATSPFTCDKCDKVFATMTGYCVHKRTHLICKKKGMKVTTSTAGRMRKVSKVCYQCGKTFQHANTYNLHMLFHSKTKPFGCEICNKTFYTRNDLTDHVNVHTAERQYPCPECDKIFLRRRNLRKHRKTHSALSRTLQCLVCPKRFMHKYQMQVHMMIHTGDRPFPCDHCPSKFRLFWELRRHLKRLHGIDETTIETLDTQSMTPIASAPHHNQSHHAPKPDVVDADADADDVATVK